MYVFIDKVVDIMYNNSMKTFKLDKRYNGHKVFTYGIQFYRNELDKFIEVRNWCWHNWGPGAEIEHHALQPNVWSWECSQFNKRIYLQTDKEYNWFTLKWK